MTNLDKLERLARAAPKGPWTAHVKREPDWTDAEVLAPEWYDDNGNDGCWVYRGGTVALAHYIAALDPRTVLDLIARVRGFCQASVALQEADNAQLDAAEAETEAWARSAENHGALLDALSAATDRLKSAVTAYNAARAELFALAGVEDVKP